MSIAWENNPNGICEDAPCCGCCGPQGDGRYYPDEPPEYDDYDIIHDHDLMPICESCCEETSYGSTMWGSREVWYCENPRCQEKVCDGPEAAYR
jgi:hypothetical protein